MFYAELGMTGMLPPVQHLLQIIQRSHTLPNINNVVDSYNIVSAQALLSLGAHDLAHINGDIHFKLTYHCLNSIFPLYCISVVCRCTHKIIS